MGLSERHHQLLDDINSSERKNFKGADFQDKEFIGYLEGYKFHKCDFEEANFTDTKLPKCSIGVSNFYNAKLIRTDMREARLYRVDFQGAFFEDFNLENSFLDRVNFEGVDLRKINLKGAEFNMCRLKGAILPEGFYQVVGLLADNEPITYCAASDQVIISHRAGRSLTASYNSLNHFRKMIEDNKRLKWFDEGKFIGAYNYFLSCRKQESNEQ